MRRGLTLIIALLSLSLAAPASAFFCFNFSAGGKGRRQPPPPLYMAPLAPIRSVPYHVAPQTYAPRHEMMPAPPERIDGWRFRPLPSRSGR